VRSFEVPQLRGKQVPKYDFGLLNPTTHIQPIQCLFSKQLLTRSSPHQIPLNSSSLPNISAPTTSVVPRRNLYIKKRKLALAIIKGLHGAVYHLFEVSQLGKARVRATCIGMAGACLNQILRLYSTFGSVRAATSNEIIVSTATTSPMAQTAPSHISFLFITSTRTVLASARVVLQIRSLVSRPPRGY
jgi:hypothetical protein